MKVYCIKCGKCVDIPPDGLGNLSQNLIWWIMESGEKCEQCLTKAKESASVSREAHKEQN